MLTHPTHERLIALGLIGMAKALEEQRRSPDLNAHREAAERDTKRLHQPQVRRAAPERLHGRCRLANATRHRSRRIRQTHPRRLDDRNENLLVTGSNRAGQELDCLRSVTRLAATTDRSSIIASRACSRRSPSRAATAAMAACSKPSAGFNSSSSTIGACQFSIRPNGATFWRSTMIATVVPPPSSPARSPSNIGTRRCDPGSPRSQRSPPSTYRRKHAKADRPQATS